jgi:hypothetical protein
MVVAKGFGLTLARNDCCLLLNECDYLFIELSTLMVLFSLESTLASLDNIIKPLVMLTLLGLVMVLHNIRS